MKIDLAELPDEGKEFEGEIPAEFFGIDDKNTKAASPLAYHIKAQRFDNELLITGALQATFELTCMRSLHNYLQTIEIPQAAISIEIEDQSVIDAADELREEILLELPTNPRCEDGDVPGTCEIDPKYLAVDNPTDAGVDNAPAQDKPSPWAALDALDSND
ncbi:MAG: YceD family protein [Akkermansiaceae bacterium]